MTPPTEAAMAHPDITIPCTAHAADVYMNKYAYSNLIMDNNVYWGLYGAAT